MNAPTKETAKGRIDFAADDEPEEAAADQLDDVLATTFRGLPLSYSPAAQAAAFRHGMNMMGLAEDDYYGNGSYPGMNDDAAITVFCSLCAADAGLDPECPEGIKSLLRRRTLRFNRNQLSGALLQFVDEFGISPMDEAFYELGFGLIAGDSESKPTPETEGGGEGKK